MSANHDWRKFMKRQRYEADRTNRARQRAQWSLEREAPTSDFLPVGLRQSTAIPEQSHDEEFYQTSDGQWHPATTIPEETRWKRWWRAREREAGLT